jgi:hypothetical protein
MRAWHEIYAAQYAYGERGWQVLDAPMLTTVERLQAIGARRRPRSSPATRLRAFRDELDRPGAAL